MLFLKHLLKLGATLTLVPLYVYGCDDLTLGLPKSQQAPKVLWSENQNYCGGTPVINISFPRKVNNINLSAINVMVEEDGETVLDINLSPMKDEGRGFFCLAQKFLRNTRVTLDYGYDNCLGFQYRYFLDDLSLLKNKGVLDLKPVNLEG